MNKILLLAAGAILFSTPLAWAQETDSDYSSVPPPKAPYVARTAQRSAWVIEFTPSVTNTPPAGATPPSQPPPRQLKQQTWTKTGNLMKCVTDWSDGSTTEDWVVGAVLFSIDPVQKGVHLYSPKLDLQYHDFSTSDFAMLDWIKGKDYDRVVKRGDDLCYLFSAKTLATKSTQTSPHNKTRAELAAPTTPTTVYISVQSGLPLEIDDGTGKFLFHYLPAPSSELKLPAPIVTLLKSYQGH